MLRITEVVKDSVYEISLKSNDTYIGEFIKEDGLYYFRDGRRYSGVWSQEFLVSLTTELTKLNKEVNDSIDEYFNFQ